MAYRIMMFMLCFAFVACGNDSKQTDASTTGDTGGGGDGNNTGDGGITGDASVGAACGATTCSSTQECCIGGGSGDTCVTAGTCNTVAFGCDGPEDCTGNTVCCYGNTGSGSAGTGGSECKMASQCNTTACHIDADCTIQGATKCCDIGMTLYNICLAQCP